MDKKIALVTGGNRGIGLEICRRLLENNIYVLLAARDEQKGITAVEQLKTKNAEIDFIKLDVSNKNSIYEAVEKIEKEFNRLDILINNAGVFLDKNVPAANTNMQVLKDTFDVNLYGAVLLTQRIIPMMKKNGYGRIVNVSSRMGQFATLGSGSLAYRISKTALNGFTKIIASEIEDENIVISCCSPGWVKTQMGGMDAQRTVEQGADTPVWLALHSTGEQHGRFYADRTEEEW